MRLILTILFISSILPLCTSNYIRQRKPINSKIDFENLALKNKECVKYYETNVITYYKLLFHVSFTEYLEYWWNSEETDIELLDRVCNFIYDKYGSNINENYTRNEEYNI